MVEKTPNLHSKLEIQLFKSIFCFPLNISGTYYLLNHFLRLLQYTFQCAYWQKFVKYLLCWGGTENVKIIHFQQNISLTKLCFTLTKKGLSSFSSKNKKNMVQKIEDLPACWVSTSWPFPCLSNKPYIYLVLQHNLRKQA